MATTNQEIIFNEVLMRGITEDVHTYAKWRSLGYQVKKGEKALFQTMLWKKKTKKSKKDDTENVKENVENVENEEGKENKNNNYFFLAKSSMFGKSQVELITVGN